MLLQEKLVYLRKNKGLSQLELSEELKVSRQAVSKWEVGTAIPSVDNLQYLSKLYDVSMDYLLDPNAGLPAKEADNNAKHEIHTVIATPMKSKPTKKLFITTILLLVSIVIGGISVFAYKKIKDNPDIVPMSKMEQQQNDDTPVKTIDIEW